MLCSQENALPKQLHGLILPSFTEHQGGLERGQCCGCALVTPRNYLRAQGPHKHVFLETKLIKWIVLLNE